MNKKFVYQVGNNKKVILWCTAKQTSRCNSFTSLLLDVYVWLNMFRALPCPSSGTYNCIGSLWFYRWSVVSVAALLVVVWKVITYQTTTNNTATATLQR